MLRLLWNIACITSRSLSCEVTSAVALAGGRPSLATAIRILLLNCLATLRAVFQSAFCAHVRIAHPDIEAILSTAFFECGRAGCNKERSDESNNLHYWMLVRFCWQGDATTRVWMLSISRTRAARASACHWRVISCSARRRVGKSGRCESSRDCRGTSSQLQLPHELARARWRGRIRHMRLWAHFCRV